MSLCIMCNEEVASEFEGNDLALAMAEIPGKITPEGALMVHRESGAVLARHSTETGWTLTAGGLLFQMDPPPEAPDSEDV